MLPQKLAEELARRALTDEAAKWFARLVWSTRLVVIGVVVEGIAVIHEVFGVSKRWFQRKKELADLKTVNEIFPVSDTIIGTEAESHTPTWVKIVAFLGLVAVAVGVGGEWKYEVKFEAATDAIQTFDSNRVTEAEKEAGDAQTSANGAAEAASRAKASADAAGATSNKAQQKAGDVAKQADELNRELLATKTQLGTVDAKRAELEKSLINLAVCNAPRVISPWFLMSGKVSTESYVDPLRPMAGQLVFIEVVPDEEARRAARNLAQTLADARWNLQIPMKSVDGLADGVSVQPSVFAGAHTLGKMPDMSPYLRGNDAAEKLLDFLHSNNWQAARGWQIDNGKMVHDLPAGSIRIQIGLYPPSVYVSPPAQKELASRLEEQKQESKRKLEEEWAKLPPEVRQRLQQGEAEWDAKAKSQTDNGPCQVLNPLF